MRPDLHDDFPRLDPLAARYGLSAAQLRALGAYGRMLAFDERAPTTVRSPQAVLRDHLADALVGLEVEELARARLVADLGSGPGVPGLPLAIALPAATFILVEGNSRKCSFMREAVALVGAANVEVVNARAEAWVDGLGRMDAVTARALAPLDVVAEYAAPLLRLGGALVAWRGQRDVLDEADGARAAEILGLEVLPPRSVSPYPEALHRHLHVMVKREPTPARFPRREGVARKRPLGRPPA